MVYSTIEENVRTYCTLTSRCNIYRSIFDAHIWRFWVICFILIASKIIFFIFITVVINIIIYLYFQEIFFIIITTNYYVNTNANMGIIKRKYNSCKKRSINWLIVIICVSYRDITYLNTLTYHALTPYLCIHYCIYIHIRSISKRIARFIR